MQSQNNSRILYVDDDECVREVTDVLLEDLGYQKMGAANGAEALAILANNSIDLILTDVQMPGCDGIELLRLVRSKYGSSPPVILMSGFSDVPIWRMLDMGANYFIGKPFNPTQFKNVIASHLKANKDRWNRTTAVNADVTLNLTFDTVDAINATTGLSFGRSGMYVGVVRPDLLKGKTVEFKIQMPRTLEVGTLCGTGTVRWSRQTETDSLPPGVGIEFDILDTNSIEFIVELAEKNGRIANIPAGPTPIDYALADTASARATIRSTKKTG